MSQTATLDDLRAALAQVMDPAHGTDLISAGCIKGLVIEGDTARFVIEADPARGAALEPVRRAAEAAALALPGISHVSAVLTAHVAQGQARPAPKGPKGPNSPKGPKGPVPDLGLKPKAPPAPPAKALPEGVARIIAVASGKGGVGKSTVTANLAVALAARGMRVGVLDADVYGPSQPRMLGVSGRPSSPDGTTILPLRNHGVTLMSLGLMTPEDEAIIWRGPMLIGALTQMLTQVAWGKLDVLLVDLPPGTGDVQMTLAQKTEVSGAIVVSTPQDIALIDARKGIDMFKRMEVPILGLVENMSAFVCDGCGKVHHPFGHGGARAEATKLGVPFLGEIPLDLAVREAGDSGAPIVVQNPDGPESQAFWALAEAVEKAMGETKTQAAQ